MSLKPFQFSKTFAEDRCDYCGQCLVQCPVLHYSPERAAAELHALTAGAPSQVLDHCTGCMACNAFCPQSANPHTLIVRRWGERYEQNGVPYAAGLVLPYQDPNVYTVALRSLPTREKELVGRWEQNWLEPPPVDTMIYAGCNVLLQPFLMDSGLYRGVPIFGSLKLCCGEPFYRMGAWEAAKAAAESVQREFQRMKLKKVIVPCLAGYHLFKYVYPVVFDTPLDIEVISIEAWLLDRISSGEIKVTPLNQSAVLHDNCWPKASGDALFDTVRALLNAIGVRVVEPEHTRERALCCGMCAGAARLRLRDIVRVAQDRLKELDASPAESAVNYCGGCNWLFSLAGQLSARRPAKAHYHLLELVQLAAGEQPARRTAQRTRSIMAAMAPRLAHRYLRGGRIKVKLPENRDLEP